MKFKRYAEYKDSGVEWLGQIPEHWKVIKIKRLCLVKRGASPRPIEDPIYFDDDGEYSWVRIADVTASKKYLNQTQQKLSELGKSKSVALEPGNIFLSIAATVGKPIITKIKCCIHDGFVYFDGLKENIEFLYYLFSCGEAYKGLGKLGTQLNLNTDTIGDIYISLPGKKEQDRIVEYSDNKAAKIDALIEKKERLIELLKDKRNALITHVVTKGIDPNVPMKDSRIEWLGNIPTNWEALQFRRGIRFLTDFEANGSFSTIKESVNLDRGEPYAWYVRATDLENEKIGISEETRYCDRETYQFLRKTRLQGGELLVTKRGEIGKVYLMPILNEPATLGPNLYLVKLNAILFPQFAYLWFSSNLGKQQLELANKSTTIGAIYKDDIKSCICLFPSVEEQKAICNFLNNKTAKIDALINKTRETVEKLKEYRTALISAAVTGKIDVREEAG